jgi:hypothetical protein
LHFIFLGKGADDTPPNFLIDSTPSLRAKTMEKEGTRVCFLTRNISRVEGHVETQGWGAK